MGQRVRLGGLLLRAADGEEHEKPEDLTVKDKWGAVEVRTAAGSTVSGKGPLVIVEGTAEERHGLPLVVGAKVSRPLPSDGELQVGEPRLRLVWERVNSCGHRRASSGGSAGWTSRPAAWRKRSCSCGRRTTRCCTWSAKPT
jgi:hypothetical protein